jgi:hypothetical protein
MDKIPETYEECLAAMQLWRAAAQQSKKRLKQMREELGEALETLRKLTHGEACKDAE